MLKPVLGAIARTLVRVRNAKPELKASFLKTWFFGDGGKWQGMRQMFVTIQAEDANRLSPAAKAQVAKQVDLLNNLVFERVQQSKQRRADALFVDKVVKTISDILSGNYTATTPKHDDAEKIYILHGLIFGCREYQGLKQGLVTILNGGDEQQVWRQLRAIETYMGQ